MLTGRTHPASPLLVREALGSLPTEIGRLFWAHLRAMITPFATLAGQPAIPSAALMNGVNVLLGGRLGIRPGSQLHLDAVPTSRAYGEDHPYPARRLVA